MEGFFTSNPPPFETGRAPTSHPTGARKVTEKEKVDLWFSNQLLGMKGDDAFICLMVCFPLLELFIRYELEIPDDLDVTLSDGSPALHWFAKFMEISDAQSREVWDAFRNGLAHRAMIKGRLAYVLSGEKNGRVAKIEEKTLTLYIWTFRDHVVEMLRTVHQKLWRNGSSPLPVIYRRD